MKISYNWLKQFVQITQTPQELSLILTNIGLEVESLDRVQPIVGGLEGLVIGEVISCVQHPNADRLRVTTVNAGGDELLQIVCGAPNVATGQRVVVAPVGATVFPNEENRLKLISQKSGERFLKACCVLKTKSVWVFLMMGSWFWAMMPLSEFQQETTSKWKMILSLKLD